MEYRLSVTGRLLAVGVFAAVALLVLLFALGFVLGRRIGPDSAPAAPLPSAPAVQPVKAAP